LESADWSDLESADWSDLESADWPDLELSDWPDLERSDWPKTIISSLRTDGEPEKKREQSEQREKKY
jgi:hypothetical protein